MRTLEYLVRDALPNAPSLLDIDVRCVGDSSMLGLYFFYNKSDIFTAFPLTRGKGPIGTSYCLLEPHDPLLRGLV